MIMNEEPLISVIIPVYNVECYIHRCIRSILRQSYKQIEIILVDDGSTDKSGSICDEYCEVDSRVSVIHKENGGVSSARNAGLDAATGDYICFCDSDDWVETDFLQSLLSLIRASKADAAFNTCYYDSDRLHYIHDNNTDRGPRIMSGEMAEKELLMRSIFPGGVVFGIYRKDIIDRFRFDESISMGEDRLMLANIFTVCNSVAYEPRSYYHYCKAEESLTHSINSICTILEEFKIEEKVIVSRYPKLKRMCRTSALYAICFFAVNVAINNQDGNNTFYYELAREEAKKNFRFDSFIHLKNKNKIIMMSVILGNKAIDTLIRLRNLKISLGRTIKRVRRKSGKYD